MRCPHCHSQRFYVKDPDMVNLGSFLLREEVIETTEGMRACQAYGKAIGELLGT
jgi:hypothetical protein